MLILGRDAEICKKESDDKDVVHREREFDEITGEEFQRFLPSPQRAEGQREKHRETKPNRRPEQRFAKRYDVRAAINDSKINCENDEDENNESRPVPPGDLNHC